MSKKVYKSTKKYACPFCDEKMTRMDLISHVERKHEALIPENYSPARVVYDSINKTDHGTCMICKKPVYTWNDKICRYNNLCDNPKCREEVRRIALERHIKTYNVPTLLTSPEHQEKMLANRHISGTYKHTDGGKFTYTGKYEKAAIEFMDTVLNIPSKDIQMPGPTLEYNYQGEIHTWITDIYYIPANLIIEVKDGGSNPNNRSMPEYRAKQSAKEVMITELGTFNYLRLTNNDFAQLLECLADIKYENMDQKEAPKVVFHINESAFDQLSKNLKVKYSHIYHLSESNNDKITLQPRIPDNFMTKNGYEDDKTPRVCLSSSINGCLRALSSNIKGKTFYVYIPDDKDIWKHVVTPTKKQVPDCKVTGEVWVKQPVTLKCIGSIKVGESIGEGHSYTYGDKDQYGAMLYDWEWSWIKKVNEEVGGMPAQSHLRCDPVIIPYMMDNTFNVAVTDTDMDTIYTQSDKDQFDSMPYPEAVQKMNYDTKIIIPAPARFTSIHETIKHCKDMDEVINSFIGHKIRVLSELAFVPGVKYISTSKNLLESKLISNGILRENEILSGAIKPGVGKCLKGNVILSQCDKGYFIHTPSDYALSSDYYDTPEDIPQNVIDTMDDLYKQYQERKVNE